MFCIKGSDFEFSDAFDNVLQNLSYIDPVLDESKLKRAVGLKEGFFLAIVGAYGSGKSRLLTAMAYGILYEATHTDRILITAPHNAGVEALALRIGSDSKFKETPSVRLVGSFAKTMPLPIDFSLLVVRLGSAYPSSPFGTLLKACRSWKDPRKRTSKLLQKLTKAKRSCHAEAADNSKLVFATPANKPSNKSKDTVIYDEGGLSNDSEVAYATKNLDRLVIAGDPVQFRRLVLGKMNKTVWKDTAASSSLSDGKKEALHAAKKLRIDSNESKDVSGLAISPLESLLVSNPQHILWNEVGFRCKLRTSIFANILGYNGKVVAHQASPTESTFDTLDNNGTTHEFLLFNLSERTDSYSNKQASDCVSRVVSHFSDKYGDGLSALVLSGYSNQDADIRKQLSKLPNENCTMRASQGWEKDLVILVATSVNGQFSQFYDPRLLLVSLTRMKSLVVLVGNLDDIMKTTGVWASFIKFARSTGAPFLAHDADLSGITVVKNRNSTTSGNMKEIPDPSPLLCLLDEKYFSIYGKRAKPIHPSRSPDTETIQTNGTKFNTITTDMSCWKSADERDGEVRYYVESLDDPFLSQQVETSKFQMLIPEEEKCGVYPDIYSYDLEFESGCSVTTLGKPDQGWVRRIDQRLYAHGSVPLCYDGTPNTPFFTTGPPE